MPCACCSLRSAVLHQYRFSSGSHNRSIDRIDADAGLASRGNGDIFESNGVFYVEAREGDTAETIAQRVGVSSTELADLNGIFVSSPLERGRVLTLPPNFGAGQLDVAGIAEDALADLDSVPAAPFQESSPEVQTQIRHRVKPGETAYSIARLYEVSVRALAEWNGLDARLTIRPDQTLLIPRPASAAGSPFADGEDPPPPPSSTQPLPEDSVIVPLPESPNMGEPQPTGLSDGSSASPEDADEIVVTDTTADSPEPSALGGGVIFVMPLDGKITATYSGPAGGNEGIDITATAGAPVVAAADGKVVLISRATDGTAILLLSHADNYFTVYNNLSNILHEKGMIVKRRQQIGSVASGDRPVLDFEIRKGTRSVDPLELLQDAPAPE